MFVNFCCKRRQSQDAEHITARHLLIYAFFSLNNLTDFGVAQHKGSNALGIVGHDGLGHVVIKGSVAARIVFGTQAGNKTNTV